MDTSQLVTEGTDDPLTLMEPWNGPDIEMGAISKVGRVSHSYMSHGIPISVTEKLGDNAEEGSGKHFLKNSILGFLLL